MPYNVRKILFLILLMVLPIAAATTAVFHLTQGYYKDFIRGRRHFNAHRYRKSIYYFESAYENYDNSPELMQYMIWNYSKLGKQDKVTEILSEMINLNPEDIDSLKYLAGTYYELDEYAKAEDIYREICNKTNDKHARRKLAEVLTWQKKYDQSLPLFEGLLIENPNDTELIELMADVYSWKKDYGSSVAMFKKLLEMTSKDKEQKRISLKLADVYRYDGQDEEAIKLYEAFVTY